MDSITQDMKYRYSLMKYAERSLFLHYIGMSSKVKKRDFRSCELISQIKLLYRV